MQDTITPSLATELLRSIPIHLVPVATLTLIFLILRSPAGAMLTKKLLNGTTTDSNGKKVNTAGDSSIEFWREQLREIIEEGFERRERDDERRHEELKSEMRTMVDLQRQDVNMTHDSATRIIDAIRSPGRRDGDWPKPGS